MKLRNNILPFIYKLIYTCISLSLLVVIYLINKGVTLGSIIESEWLSRLPEWMSYCIYAIIPIIMSYLLTLLFPLFGKANLTNANIGEIESANSAFLPVYMAYVFVGLSINNCSSLIYCLLLLIVLCFLSQSYVFNPLFYFLGYKYYFVTNSTKHKLLIMTRRNFRLNETLEFQKLAKLNDFTFIDLGWYGLYSRFDKR